MQLITAKRIWDLIQLGGEGDPQGFLQEIEIWPYEKIVHESVPENETYTLLWDFEIPTGHLISTRPSDGRQKNIKKREPAE